MLLHHKNIYILLHAGHVSTLKLLRTLEAPLTTPDEAGDTPLDLARRKHRIEAVQELERMLNGAASPVIDPDDAAHEALMQAMQDFSF